MTVGELLAQCEARPGANMSEIDAAEVAIEQQLPSDYRAFLLECNGTEGFLSTDEYIMLWSAAEIGELNRGHVIAEIVPGVTLVGTNGGNTGYGFRMSGKEFEYVSLPLIGMEPDEVLFLGKTLFEFLDRLRKGECV